ncbi:prolyl aminopeptidase [Candidatus Odyssella thessalonicensis]|uniref:prolyl aminopeptidase n=1 Tax=Candidatus Odyssella thessalonicensis TaxID=84647 RepID=UPI000225A931|nr:prolyl aminopeptidase [Candidatus Odyssella thessalonicensis]
MRTELYPDITPNHTGFIKLDELHNMYWEECGNPHGVPIVFIHGGPGAGAGAAARRFFDPEFYRIIVYDQRGSGRSTPLGETRHNTTPHLINDLEVLRAHLNIESWLVFGGSWGSTLAIAYAEHHPQRCRGLILRGLFLCRQQEIDWFLYGMNTIFPEQWQEFASHIPMAERHDLLTAYHQRLLDPNPEIHMPAALAWSKYEGACATLMPCENTVQSFLDPVLALGLARMEAHYFSNNIFLPENFLLENLDKIRHIPTIMVQGRYDIVCPIVTADEIAKNLPEAEYIVVPDAGHSAFDPPLRRELMKACEKMKSVMS